MRFLTEEPPARGMAMPVLPGIRRVVADNPGPMTYHGTNTYLLDWKEGVAVVDPGPEDAAHVERVAAAGSVTAILLTHGHSDHVGGAAALRAATAAPLFAFDSRQEPDVRLDDGASVGEWIAVHTPGHAADHLCFARADGVVLSGDHVMGWSTTVVGGAGDDMGAYVRSLERVLELGARVLLPGHGPAVPDPDPFIRGLLAHRRMREAAILRALGREPVTVLALVTRLYPELAAHLAAAAAASVTAHLRKLQGEGRAAPAGEGWVTGSS